MAGKNGEIYLVRFAGEIPPFLSVSFNGSVKDGNSYLEDEPRLAGTGENGGSDHEGVVRRRPNDGRLDLAGGLPGRHERRRVVAGAVADGAVIRDVENAGTRIVRRRRCGIPRRRRNRVGGDYAAGRRRVNRRWRNRVTFRPRLRLLVLLLLGNVMPPFHIPHLHNAQQQHRKRQHTAARNGSHG
nr:hypothetical protein B296_00009127 [Ipomoea batatas]